MSVYLTGASGTEHGPFERAGRLLAPQTACVYAYCHPNGSVSYVGETNDLERRNNEHQRDACILSSIRQGHTLVYWPSPDKAVRIQVEDDLVSKLKPDCNKK